MAWNHPAFLKINPKEETAPGCWMMHFFFQNLRKRCSPVLGHMIGDDLHLKSEVQKPARWNLSALVDHA